MSAVIPAHATPVLEPDADEVLERIPSWFFKDLKPKVKKPKTVLSCNCSIAVDRYIEAHPELKVPRGGALKTGVPVVDKNKNGICRHCGFYLFLAVPRYELKNEEVQNGTFKV